MYVCAECGERYEQRGRCAYDDAMLMRVDDPLLGTDVARYRLTRVLGRGGMGTVYLAIQPQIGSRVAIKILSESCATDAELLERFFAEARAVNVIRHEHIISVLDLDRLPSGRPYIVMEYVDGHTLRDARDAGPVPLGGLVSVMSEVLRALHAAHAVGIVHRDLKPDNVMVTGAGHAKVLDFGIAKLMHLPGPRTQTGVALGTPAYMAPEQIEGEPVDARTDVYSAGVVLFELATGVRLFEGPTDFEYMRAHLEDPPRSPRALRPDLPASLEAVILQALAKSPADRFQTAKAMARALRQVATELPAPERKSLAPGAWLAPTPASSAPFSAAKSEPSAPELPSTGATVRDRPSQPDLATVADRPSARSPQLAPRSASPPTRAAVARAPAPAVRASSRVGYVVAGLGGAVVAAIVTVIATRASSSPPAPGPTTPTEPNTPPPVSNHSVVFVAPPADAAVAVAVGPLDDASIPPADAASPSDASPTTRAAIIAVEDALARAQRDASQRGHPDGKPTAPTFHPDDDWQAQLQQTVSDGDPGVHQFDMSAYLPRATALARQLAADAQLVDFHGTQISPSGLADSPYSSVFAYRFRSPSRSRGESQHRLLYPCMLWVVYEQAAGHTPQIVARFDHDQSVARDVDCTAPITRAPRCTTAMVWTKAIVAGESPTELAEIRWAGGVWTFQIGGRPVTIADDCP